MQLALAGHPAANVDMSKKACSATGDTPTCAPWCDANFIQQHGMGISHLLPALKRLGLPTTSPGTSGLSMIECEKMLAALLEATRTVLGSYRTTRTTAARGHGSIFRALPNMATSVSSLHNPLMMAA